MALGACTRDLEWDSMILFGVLASASDQALTCPSVLESALAWAWAAGDTDRMAHTVRSTTLSGDLAMLMADTMEVIMVVDIMDVLSS